MKPTQNVHRQETTETKPDIRGANRGPHAVAWDSCQSSGPANDVRLRTATNTAIARPLMTGSLNISAYRPPTTAIGLEALMPHMRRKTRNAGQFGAKAQAIVKSVKTTKVDKIMSLLPYVSLRGPKTKGPSTYPTRYREIGRTSCCSSVTWKYGAM